LARLKQPARLAELITSGLGELRGWKIFRGWKLQHLKDLRELREKKKKKEEETKPRHYRITTVIIPYVFSCFVFFVRQPVSFIFKD